MTFPAAIALLRSLALPEHETLICTKLLEALEKAGAFEDDDAEEERLP